MRAHTLNKTNLMRITPNNQNKSSRTSTAGMGSNYRIVLTKASPKRVQSGYSLADMIVSRGRLNDKRVISIAISILDALIKRMTEGGGPFPRNITPASIIFKENGCIEFEEAEPKITLVSKSEDDGKKSTISGIPAYMSPENATGLNEGSQAGIYTFGAIMYEMLTGLPPYNGGSPLETLAAVKQGPPTKLAQLNLRANHKLIAICEKCMNRGIRQRYLSLFDVLSELENLQAQMSPNGGSRIKGWVCSMLSACL